MWYLVMSRPAVPREQVRPHAPDHLAWMRRQHGAGNVLFSGPASDRSMGIYVIRAPSLDEANQVAGSDPFHDTGVRSYEIVEWDVHQVMGAGAFTQEGIAALAEKPRKVS